MAAGAPLMLKFGYILVYLKCWTLYPNPLMVYPQLLFHPMFSIKAGLTFVTQSSSHHFNPFKMFERDKDDA